METFLGFVHFLSLSTWVGGLAFLLVLVTPTIFRVLSDDLAQTVDHHIFSAYYVLAVACGVGALVSLLSMRAVYPAVPWFWLRLGLLVTMTALTLNTAWAIHPRLQRKVRSAPGLAPQDEEEAGRVAGLERLAAHVNGLVLLLGLTILWLSVGGPSF
ncbi:MAG: DUF4149 domain-containing protein [Acidobacteriota bacterium]